MIELTLLRMALRNLGRNKKRNITTGIAISCGFAAFVALGGYLNRVRYLLDVLVVDGMRRGHVTIMKKNAVEKFSIKPQEYSFNEAEQKKIETILAANEAVSFFGPNLTGTGLIGNGCRTYPFVGVGFDPVMERRVRELPEVIALTEELKNFVKGGMLYQYPPEIGPVVLAEGLARLLHKPKIYDEVAKGSELPVALDCEDKGAIAQIENDSNVQLVASSWIGGISAIDAEVVAHFQTGVTETNNTELWMPLSLFQKLFETKNASVYAVWLKPLTVPLNLAIVYQIQNKLKEAGLDAEAFSWTDPVVTPYYRSTLSFFNTLVGFAAFILSIIIMFSIFNSSTMTVIERSQEIGMMRSLGFTEKKIRQVFLMEGVLLTLLAILGGALIAALGIGYVNYANIPFKPPGTTQSLRLLLTPDWLDAIAALVVVSGISFLTTLLAVWAVSKQTIANLLLKVQR